MLVAGFGIPARRDLDFGTQVVKDLHPLDWPEGVVVEELSCSVHLALHRLLELRPRKLVLVGAVARGAGPPGFVHRRRPGPGPVVPEVVHQAMVEPVSGAAGLDHTLAVLRHWGALPAETVLVEVEPADCGYGLGFSEDLLPCFDTILALLHEELEEVVVGEEVPPEPEVPSEPTLEALVDLAEQRRAARVEDEQRRAPARPGRPSLHRSRGDRVELVWTSRPWGIGVESGSDWHDRFPLDGGLVGVVVGHVPGRGPAAVALMSDMRMAVRAYATIDGHDPARVVECLDRLATTTGRGEGTTLLYLTLDPASGDLRLCTAGHCSPLVVDRQRLAARFVRGTRTPPVGAEGSAGRHVLTTHLAPGSTLLAYTDGLVVRPGRSPEQSRAALHAAALSGPPGLEDLCDHVLVTVMDRKRRGGDVSLLGLRLASS